MKLRHLVTFTEAFVILTVTAMVVHVWWQSGEDSRMIREHYEHADSIVAVNARDAAVELLQKNDSIIRARSQEFGPLLGDSIARANECGPLMLEC